MNRIHPSKAVYTVLIGLGVVVSTFANAQNRMTYNGPRANVSVVSKSPDGDYSFCDRDPQAGLTKETYAACVKAISGARQIAEMCAKADGELDGFNRGFSWGLHHALDRVGQDPNPVNQGRQSILAEQSLDAYLRQKANEVNANAFSEGSSRGASEAIRRFIQFVDSGASQAGGFPSRALPNPIPVPGKAAPYANPYLSLMPGQFQSIEELIDREVFDSNRIAFMNRYDSMYWGRGRPQMAVRGLYTTDGIYGPNPSLCGNPDEVFNRWVGHDRMGKGIYGGYAPKGPAVAKDGSVPGAGPTKGDVVPGGSTASAPNFQEIYRRSFLWGFGGYSNYYYSVGFYEQLDYGQWYGNAVGLNVGGKYYYQVGRRDAFNEKFHQIEAAVYANNATQGYLAGFNSAYDDYQRNPQPAFELIDVVGEVDDGIIQPNERIALSIRVKNYGGVDTRFPAQLAGNVSEVQGFMLEAPALSSKGVTSPIVARVTSASGSNARVVLQVAGREIPINAYVTDQVTPASITYDASVPNGIVKVIVTLVNNSRVKSYDVVKVNLVDAFGHNVSQNLGFLEAKQSMPVVFSLSDYNPLDLIDGKVNLQAQSYLGSLSVGTQNVSVRSSNPKLDLAQAFVTLAQDKSKVGILAMVKQRVRDVLDQETRDLGTGGELKRDDGQGNSLYLITTLKDAIRGRQHSQNAHQVYAQLNGEVRGFLKRMKAFLGKGRNYKEYEELLGMLN